MDVLQTIIPVIIVLFIIFVGGFFIWYSIRQNKSVIERARKIDPSVQTVTEARYVLQKDIAKNLGNNKNNEN